MSQEDKLEEVLEEVAEDEHPASEDETALHEGSEQDLNDSLSFEQSETSVHPNPVIRFLFATKQFFVDFYEANFKSAPEEPQKPVSRSKIDSSPRALRADFERRSKRTVGHITGNSVSSTRGNPTRQKQVRVTAKTYKPELDRF